MTLEQLESHIRYLRERDNSEVTPEKFEKDMEILLKYISQIKKLRIN